MHKALIALAVFAVAASPAVAQGVPQQGAAPPAAKPQTVKKTVCRRVDDEETTGSRVGSAPKVCKTIEVPTGAGDGGTGDGRAPTPRPERG